jgi:GAF domain-containing protein
MNVVRDPERLALVRRLSAMESQPDPEFDRLARFAASLLRTPAALVTLVEEDRQLFYGCCGVSEPWASARETPLSRSFCHHVVAAGKPLVVSDARQHPLLCDHPAVDDLGIVAYLGVPLCVKAGHRLGALCVIDSHPRDWLTADVAAVDDLAAWAVALIERRVCAADLQRAEQDLAMARAAGEAATLELDQLRRSRKQFVTFVTHELSTPLTVIQGFSEMLRDEALSPDEVREYAADINKEAARLAEIIAQARADQRASGG